ncbi:MAG: Coenzyme F420:L-glutamate ligase [Methanosaeta sp. PtaU1.Bin112]|nr:MAG: Coenzyme F420:L-glutamate ligase [Methanosaeta sp. PtaU1.Bin112]
MQGYLIAGLPIIKQGDDIASLVKSLFNFQDGDVLCLASTIVAKSEGRFRELEDYHPSSRAAAIARNTGKDPRFVQAVLDESADILLDRPFMLVQTRFGHVGVNAGIDQSNVGADRILLLPEDPAGSAERLRARLGKDCAVIITDTCGRPFRSGVAGVAIGWAGIAPLRDWRGVRDLHGKALEITLEAVVDEIAAMANMLMGEAGDGTPAVVFRGLQYPRSGESSVFMPEERDVIRPRLKR